MRLYTHDYIWKTQDRRRMPDPPGMFLLDVADWAGRRLRERRERRARLRTTSEPRG